MQSPDSDQYHSQLPWIFVHLVCSSVVSCLSICDDDDDDNNNNNNNNNFDLIFFVKGTNKGHYLCLNV
jgi:hypothetical protein